MAKMVPMLGAVIAHIRTPDADGKKANAKPKKNRTTKGEKSVVQQGQQHGELASAMSPAPRSDREIMKDRARSEKRMATENWIAGRMSTSEHQAIHKRADHILSGKHPKHFSGKTGERKIRGF